MYKIPNYKITIDEENERIDSFLSGYLSDYSRSKVQKFLSDESILVNCKKAKNSYKLKENDEISFNIKSDKEIKILPQDIKIDIRYEDENIIVVNKPSGMLTHPTVNETENTLVNALLHYTNGNLSNINGDLRQGIVHRLDRNTSGLLLIAKNNEAHNYLYEIIKERKIKKLYRAITFGKIEKDEGIIDSPIGRHPTKPHKMTVTEDGKPSITKFKVLERFQNNTYLKLDLITGRTHQIRVHLASINHPIVNDGLYCGMKFPVITDEQVLQSYSLTFKPMNEYNDVQIEIEPDEKIQKVLNYLRSKKCQTY